MHTPFEQQLLTLTRAKKIIATEPVQELWGGYGMIVRIRLDSLEHPSVIVKRVERPDDANHPRGWNTKASDQRKWTSYSVEEHWYQRFVGAYPSNIRMPRYLGSMNTDKVRYLVLEDLNAVGFSLRKREVHGETLQQCLKWLAQFHAFGLNKDPGKLWSVGTYWHLETRHDEWNAMPDGPLKEAAGKIDNALNSCRVQTIVHGDAKVANFCFAEDGEGVAALDFQYVGSGCGMKDLVCFLSSNFDGDALERSAEVCLNTYFHFLREALGGSFDQANALEEEWRSLYPIAWADYIRFLAGWAPGHSSQTDYALKMVQKALVSVAEV